MPMTHRHPRRHQGGFSLIEALVAMVVLSLGLLGLASLQINALRYNQVSQLRSQAATFAYQMLDTMRASGDAAKNGEFDVTLTGTISGTSAAASEVTAWKTNLAATSVGLPSGQGSICRTNTPDPTVACTGAGDYVMITVQWNEADDQGSRTAQTFQLVSQVVK
ncbi:type IV pilus modification protein PilV [Nitrogeniibacter mangrovi]|uniref:Type IV pilus modification protein PilV n=1 Tax=Nitrogeniibacter mangrovi TaxID=2016596 RepID=A0A6C1B1F3_9RHOO|nr:type IV pilus modification protein PilV [Nitrogeniibacter mangrovi]QID17193.1 type IV pilus modification protein PilV [Nitrogeniibacter mangrovi]